MTAETFFAKFGHLADAPNGVQKLRELILQLAVQGKLVPQDPNDEPASVLLECNEVEKRRLEKEKKIRKTKENLKTSIDELDRPLPSRWDFDLLGNIAHVITKGATPTTYGYQFQSEGVAFVKVENVKGGQIIKSNISTFISEEAHAFQARSQLEDGDILFSIAGTIGETCVVKVIDLPANTNQALAIIRGTTGVFNAAYLKMQLDSFVANAVKAKARGGAMSNVSLADLRDLLVYVPPLEEQKRIVAKVDHLMALCDELEARQQKQQQGRVRLNNAALDALLTAREPDEFSDHWQRISTNFDLLYDHPETIAKLRAAILQLAVQGKLVPQDPNDEPASVLLERVRSGRNKLVSAGKASKEKKLPPVNDQEINFEVPNSWEMVRFDSVCDSRLGKMLDKNKNKGSLYPYLRNTNVQWLKFELDDLKQMRFEDDELNEFEVRYGDLLVCEGGEPGRCAIWLDREKTVFFQKALHRVRSFSGVNNWFLLYRLWGSAQSGELSNYFTGATIKHLTGKSLGMFPLGLPPLEEQNRIVAKVDQLMALCDELEAKLDQAQQHSEKLMEATVRPLLVA